MKRIIALICVIGLSMFFAQVYADGTSGCGFGTDIFKGQTGKGPHLLAATTNGTYTQIFGITSGTAGCNPDSQVSLDRKKEVYVVSNFEYLSEEMSQGKGEYLASYAKLFGCSATAVDSFSRMTQANYEKIFADNSAATDVIRQTEHILNENPTISNSCASL